MTSNQFLGQLGEPSEVEARIGRAYESEGLPGAFAWLDENLLPLCRRQEANRLKARGLVVRKPLDKKGLPSD